MPSLPDPLIVIAPDSFKGSLGADQVAAAIAAGIRRALPDATIRQRPMADGGEGTIDAMLAAGGQRASLTVRGAHGVARTATVALLAGDRAVIESAEIVGITDPAGMACPVTQRSTAGLGDAIKALLDLGVREIFIGLGGSSTNDGGAGLLHGLGMRLLDAHGRDIEPTPAALPQLAAVDTSQLDPRLASTRLVAMCDVTNPLTGPQGATAVFGPQKGVQAQDVAAIDAALARYASLLAPALGRCARDAAGAGAAGGLGYALLMLGAQMRPGADIVADCVGLDGALAGADWLITGEGRSDVQTLSGKAPLIACQRAHACGVPATLLCGAIDPAALPALGAHFAGCFSLAPGPITVEQAMANASALLADAAEQMARLRFTSTHPLAHRCPRQAGEALP